MMTDDEIDNVEPICQEQRSSGADLSEGTVILSPKVRLEITESEVCLRPTNRSPHTKVTPSVTFCSAGDATDRWYTLPAKKPIMTFTEGLLHKKDT